MNAETAPSERGFTQADYNEIVYALDKAMLAIKDLGKTETQAQTFIKDFVAEHYCRVWRKIVAPPSQDSEAGK